ncbi:LysM domain-containing protein 3 [Elsinoe fawcettii]|nr:LysM domain-containing protein 3 [Elsinoe fawcettii]
MSKTIFLYNKSNVEQRFYVHGWNNNADLVVAPWTTANINAPDGSSGAIIAVHEGFEGEQAEITKNGFGGNDFFDISYIVGVGGNMTIKQTTNDDVKGHPTFMRACNDKWNQLDQGAKDRIGQWVHRDGSGSVVRLDRPLSSPELELFVRSFANGFGYIGVGAWKDNQGNPSDNYQSRAGQGNQDILITYSDQDATPAGMHPTQPTNSYTIKAGDTFWSIAQAFGLEVDRLQAANPGLDPKTLQIGQVIQLPCSSPPFPLPGTQIDTHSDFTPSRILALTEPTDSLKLKRFQDPFFSTEPAIELKNLGPEEQIFYFFDNYWNGDGTASANFDKPLTRAVVAPGGWAVVPLPLSFKGRVQRGLYIPATWGEFQLQDANDGKAHGDISVQQGNDGPVMVRALDGSGQENGFKDWTAAPDGAWRLRQDGRWIIDTTVGNWMGGPNHKAIDAQMFMQGKVYVVGGTGVPDVASANNRMAFDFY